MGLPGRAGGRPGRPAGSVRHRVLAQGLRQLEIYGREGLPVLSADGRQVQGWITAQGVLRAIGRQIATSHTQTTQAQLTADWEHTDPDTLLRHPPTPLPGYRSVEITVRAGSAAAGRKLGDVTWPPGSVPVSVLRGRQFRPPRPEITLAPGDRVSLLVAGSVRAQGNIYPCQR